MNAERKAEELKLAVAHLLDATMSLEEFNEAFFRAIDQAAKASRPDGTLSDNEVKLWFVLHDKSEW